MRVLLCLASHKMMPNMQVRKDLDKALSVIDRMPNVSVLDIDIQGHRRFEVDGIRFKVVPELDANKFIH